MSEPRLHRFPHKPGIGFEAIQHARAGATRTTVNSVPLNGGDLARIVMARLDGRMVMVVLGAGRCLDLAALRLATGCEAVELVPDSEFAPLLPDGETGAMPPLGNLHGLNVFVEESLSEDEEIAIGAGSQAEPIRIPFALFEQLVHPKQLRRIGRIAH